MCIQWCCVISCDEVYFTIEQEVITINYETHFHGLFEFDPERGVEFCCSIMENVEEDAMWHKGIEFSDEATFYQAESIDRLILCVIVTPMNKPNVLHENKLKSRGITE